MKVACVGGGPASLYFSILMKRVDPSYDITIYERNPAGSTYGWGVTYWGDLLQNLEGADPESAKAISESSAHWTDGIAHVGDRTTTHNGDDGFGIGRQRLLDILAERARSLGVRVEFEREITSEDDVADADLVVAGDGVNSVLRSRHAAHFGTKVAVGRNHYIWLGTTKVFDAFTFSFVETAHGWIWCYGYPYSNEYSTCVIECSPVTWRGLGFPQMNEADSLARLEKLFADNLSGHPLIGRSNATGSAQWLNFRTLTNRTWYRGNLVLLGDAAHTTHYSIGAGTTLALGDAAFLVNALHGEKGLPAALARYERERQAEILPVQSAARYSARWYENITRYIDLPLPMMFALLGERHSPLLPHVPPKLYYRIDEAAERLAPLRSVKHWLGLKIARAMHSRAAK